MEGLLDSKFVQVLVCRRWLAGIELNAAAVVGARKRG
jgi:hypothetical protein